MISGLTIIRNALTNGYPIAEVIDNLKLISDEIIVCDGYSTDGTYEYLCSRNDIRLFQDQWNLASDNGFEFAKITNLGLSRCSGDWIFYLQADELLSEEHTLGIKKVIEAGEHNSICCRFAHIRYDFDYKLTSGYEQAIRAFRNRRNIYSDYDAYNFAGDLSPIHYSDFYILHFGYVFLKNILQKFINHADLFYITGDTYATRRDLAVQYMKIIEAGHMLEPLELQPILEPMYAVTKHGLPIPECMERLRGAMEYTLP